MLSSALNRLYERKNVSAAHERPSVATNAKTLQSVFREVTPQGLRMNVDESRGFVDRNEWRCFGELTHVNQLRFQDSLPIFVAAYAYNEYYATTPRASMRTTR